ncbi:KxYKxGKxW signal peptide, partial [Bifidobacterium goeldii]
KVVADRYNSVTFGTEDDGTARVVHVSASLGTELHSVYNPNTGEHLYAFAGEAGQLEEKSGWIDEGGKFFTVQNGSAGVVRVYNPNTNGPAHVYTNGGEASVLAGLGWKIDNNAKPVFALTANK